MMQHQRSEIEKGNVIRSTVIFAEDKPAVKGTAKKKRKTKKPVPDRPKKKPKTAHGFITETKKRRKRNPVKQKLAVPDVSMYFI